MRLLGSILYLLRFVTNEDALGVGGGQLEDLVSDGCETGKMSGYIPVRRGSGGVRTSRYRDPSEHAVVQDTFRLAGVF